MKGLLGSSGILLVGLLWVRAGDPLATWHLRNPLTPADGINDIAAGSGRYVAVGNAGAIIVSEDAVHWKRQNVGILDNLNAVAFGSGQFIAVGSNGRVLASANGDEWLASNLGTNLAIQDVCFGEGRFVAAANDSAGSSAWVSFNGTNWGKTFQSGTNPFVPPNLRAIAYGNERFVIVRGGGFPLVSLDATNWIVGDTWSYSYDVAYGNGRFLAVPLDGSHDGYARISQDGLTWQAGPRLDFNHPRTAFGNELFVEAGFTSIDGLELIPRTNIIVGALYFDGSRFINSSYSGINQSPDGVHWSQTVPRMGLFFSGTGLATDGERTLVFGDALFSGMAALSYLATTNGVVWAEVKTNLPGTTSFSVSDTVFADGKFVVIAAGGSIFVSTNGMDWSNRPSGTTDWLRHICHVRSEFYVRPDSGNMLVSSDGLTWARTQFETKFWDAADDGNVIAAVDSGTNIFVSTNGVAWSTNTFASPNPLIAIAYGNDHFVAVGYQGAVVISTNGFDWLASDSRSVAFLNSVAFGAGAFVAVGSSGTIRTSIDGRTWTIQESGTRMDLQNVVWTGRSFFISGYSGVILQSEQFFATAPIIVQQPKLLTVHSGTDVSIDVIASGSSPLAFQWSRNGAALATATNSYFYRRHALPSDAGDYSVVVSNSAGSVTSIVAHVSIETNVYAPRLQVTRRSYAELDLTGTPGAEQVLEYTSTLEDSNSWRTLRTIVPTSDIFTLPDVSSTNVPRRFYRSSAR